MSKLRNRRLKVRGLFLEGDFRCVGFLQLNFFGFEVGRHFGSLGLDSPEFRFEFVNSSDDGSLGRDTNAREVSERCRRCRNRRGRRTIKIEFLVFIVAVIVIVFVDTGVGRHWTECSGGAIGGSGGGVIDYFHDGAAAIGGWAGVSGEGVTANDFQGVLAFNGTDDDSSVFRECWGSNRFSTPVCSPFVVVGWWFQGCRWGHSRRRKLRTIVVGGGSKDDEAALGSATG